MQEHMLVTRKNLKPQAFRLQRKRRKFCSGLTPVPHCKQKQNVGPFLFLLACGEREGICTQLIAQPAAKVSLLGQPNRSGGCTTMIDRSLRL